MRSQNQTNEQFLKELTTAKNKIALLKKADDKSKKIASALIQERELYTDLANALPSGIYRLRVFPEGGLVEEKWSSRKEAPYVIEFVNDRFCEILNIDRQVFINEPGIINELIFEADQKEFATKNVEANLNTTPFIWEGRFRIKGNLIWVHFVSVPRRLGNGDIIWTGTLNDISERKNAEQVIKIKNQELLKINAEKDKFLSIIAHDLRSPFNSIIGFSNILVEQVHNEDLENVKQYARIIRKSSQSAMNLLTNLMQWSLSQTGRMKFNPEYFEMGDTINEMGILFTDIAMQKAITIKKETPSEMPVYADRAMISTILRNLVSNAIKFTARGGRISILAEVVQNEVKISISDTGVGIPLSSVKKIFRIDANCSTPDTQNEKGTGLGLILCKEFIEKHGGKIWFESEPGKGSDFYFTIPGKIRPEIKTENTLLINAESN